MFFGLDQELAEVGWDCFVEQGVPGFFESWFRVLNAVDVGQPGTWSKKDGVGQLEIFWWI